jgi:hypothetical protein
MDMRSLLHRYQTVSTPQVKFFAILDSQFTVPGQLAVHRTLCALFHGADKLAGPIGSLASLCAGTFQFLKSFLQVMNVVNMRNHGISLSSPGVFSSFVQYVNERTGKGGGPSVSVRGRVDYGNGLSSGAWGQWG